MATDGWVGVDPQRRHDPGEHEVEPGGQRQLHDFAVTEVFAHLPKGRVIDVPIGNYCGGKNQHRPLRGCPTVGLQFAAVQRVDLLGADPDLAGDRDMLVPFIARGQPADLQDRQLTQAAV